MNLSAKVKGLEQFYGGAEEIVHIIFKKDWAFDIIKADGSIKRYIPTKTGKAIHELILTPNEVEAVYEQGAFASGKSTTLQADIIHRSRFIPQWKGRMRASKAAFIRNTTGELESTTLETWLQWFGDMGHYHKNKKPLMTYNHQFNFFDERDGVSGIINLKVIFIALDDEKALRKLDSLELSFAYVNEMRHLPYALFDKIKGRIRRYPSRQDIEDQGFKMDEIPFIVTGDSNPPPAKHWIPIYFEKRQVKEWKFFKQPPGLIKDAGGEWIDNPNHDTYQYIAQDYYTKLARGATDEFIKVYCLGEYGTAVDGKPVYEKVYNDNIHSMSGLIINPELPIDLGWDFGLTPACVVLQQNGNGRFYILKEFTTDRSGITQFIVNVVSPWLNANVPNWRNQYVSQGDPAGSASVQTDERTCLEILRAHGIFTTAAPTNALVPRFEAVKIPLGTLVDGLPALIVSREGAPIIRDGFITDYHYRTLRGGDGLVTNYTEAPEKNAASHPHEALQYIMLKYFNTAANQSNADEDYYNQCSREVA